MEKIRSFTGLHAWKQAHKLVLMTYEACKRFPSSEQFGLINQLQRASVSVSSNIAEGFGRTSKKEKVRFYEIAQTSLIEMQNQILVARDVKYLSSDIFKSIANQTVSVAKIINGLRNSAMSYSRTRE